VQARNGIRAQRHQTEVRLLANYAVQRTSVNASANRLATKRIGPLTICTTKGANALPTSMRKGRVMRQVRLVARSIDRRV